MAQVVELRGLQAAADALRPEIAQKAARRTINDLTTQGKTATSKKIREIYTVKAAELNKVMTVSKLSITTGAGTAKITTKGKPMPVTAFTGTRQTKGGVSVQLKKTSARAVLPHTFLRTLASGHVGAFVRVWRDKNWTAPTGTKKTGFASLPRIYRLPVREMTTISAPSMFDQDQVYAEVQSLVDAKWETTFRRNYAFYAG